MARNVLPPLVLVFIAALSGCSDFHRPERPAWRKQAEDACFAARKVTFSEFIQPSREINGPSICGLTQPLKATALQQGRVLFSGVQTLSCPMVAALDEWLEQVVQPAAMARYGEPVTQIDSMGSYVCRGMNNQPGARLSEHSFGNALDIGGFRFGSGRKLTLVHDWTHGEPEAQAFLRDLHGGACDYFTTVLSPGSNAFHYNHIHIDLAMHGRNSSGLRRVCKPLPEKIAPIIRKDNLPDSPSIEDELDIAESKTLPTPSASRLSAYDLATPSPPPRPDFMQRGNSSAYSAKAPTATLSDFNPADLDLQPTKRDR